MPEVQNLGVTDVSALKRIARSTPTLTLFDVVFCRILGTLCKNTAYQLANISLLVADFNYANKS